MASVESEVQTTQLTDQVPLVIANAGCCPGCCDDTATVSGDAPCC